MKKIVLVLLVSLFGLNSMAQNWSLDKAHSGVTFSITHMMISEVDGSFKNFDAKVVSSKADLSDAVFEFTADVSSINTGNDMRDGHLKGKDYFNADEAKTIAFKSTSFKKVKPNIYKVTGNFTMRGVTKVVTLNATVKGPVENPRSKKQMIGVVVTGDINRVDFKVGESSASLGDVVTIKAAGEFTKD